MSETPTPEKAPPKSPGAAGRLLLDLGPLLVFFLVNFLAPVPDVSRIFVATGAFMVAMLAAMAVSQIRYRFISPLLWFSALMVVVLGGLTLWLHDETFIKIKPTIYYAVVTALLVFGMATGRNLLKAVLGSAYPGLSERGWHLHPPECAAVEGAHAGVPVAGKAHRYDLHGGRAAGPAGDRRGEQGALPYAGASRLPVRPAGGPCGDRPR